MMVRDMLREAGPLSVPDILARIPDWRPPRSKNPREALRNAMANDQLVENRGDHRYVYLPIALDGATVRLPVITVAGQPGQLAVGEEVATLLWPHDDERGAGTTPLVALDGGPSIALAWDGRLPVNEDYWDGKTALVMPAPPFWDWWAMRQRAGADALILRCERHEAGRYTAVAVRSGDLDAAAVAASNARLLEEAARAMKGTQGMRSSDLCRRLFARGLYHTAMPPDPLFAILLAPLGLFIVEWGYSISYRPELTPALWRLLGHRIHQLRDMDELSAEPEPLSMSPHTVPPAAVGFRIKARLAWDKKVWRVIEILDNQTLEDLHYAIQDAFGWDDDHLYAFYPGSQFGDQLTAFGRRTGDEWDDPPTAEEVLLAELGLQPGQWWSYRFDFGDQLDHDLEVLAAFPPSAEGGFPRTVEAHGDPPPQYPEGDEGAN